MACELNGGDCSIVTFAASPTTGSQMVARAVIEGPCRPLLDLTTHRRARLALLHGGRRSAPPVPPAVEAVDLDWYRRRDDELRGQRRQTTRRTR
jgi:hypothetical protein